MNIDLNLFLLVEAQLSRVLWFVLGGKLQILVFCAHNWKEKLQEADGRTV